ncbi:MAG TPA: anti-sigma factor [Candidatus Krumholzibacteria bacterium]|nr:anti-sigma factor [Candidatus Krumholzibacteria bacterium]
MDHKIAFELLESYVFGTLDDAERAAVDAHLRAGCTECSSRLRDVSELSVHLARAVPQAAPPARVKERLFDRVRTTHHPGKSRAEGRGRVRFAWSVAAVATVAAAGFAWQAMTLQRELSVTNRLLASTIADTGRLRSEISQYRADVERYKDAMMLGEPGVRFVSLDPMEGDRDAFGSVVTKPDKSAGILYVYRFPMAPEGKEYQLWGLRDGLPPVSLGMFNVNPDGTAMLNMKSIPESTHIVGFAVTMEPKGGMPQPTGMMYVKGMDPMEENEG